MSIERVHPRCAAVPHPVSLSLSLSLSALLPGSIGLLLMCLLTSVRRLGVADARNQSRPELGERERHKAPCCEARSFPRRSESGEKAMLFHSRLVCLSLSENDFRTRSDVSSRQPSHTTGLAGGRARRAYHTLARRGAATSLHRARANIAFQPEPQPRGRRCPIASEDP